MAAPRLAVASPDIFVNREKPLELINEAIEEIPDNGVRLLVFHGIGGQGKTALCRHVYQQVSDSKDKRYKNLNVAEIDLRGKDKSDPINLLIWVRNGFANAKIACPAFDIALALTWEATRPEQAYPKLTNAWLAKSSEFMTETAPAASLPILKNRGAMKTLSLCSVKPLRFTNRHSVSRTLIQQLATTTTLPILMHRGATKTLNLFTVKVL